MAPKACETMALWHDSWFTVHRTAIYRHYSEVSSFGSVGFGPSGSWQGGQIVSTP